MNPEQKQRVGYLVKFTGLNMGDFLAEDIDVFTPYNSTETGYGEVEVDSDEVKITCVGVLESFSWEGGVGDPLCLSSYISAENAEVLSAKTKSALDTTIISELAWWIVNFDEENKVWYEEAYPLDPTIAGGQLNAPGGQDVRMTVGTQAMKVAPNIDINVYNLYFEVIPAANSDLQLPLRHFDEDEVREELGRQDRLQRRSRNGLMRRGSRPRTADGPFWNPGART